MAALCVCLAAACGYDYGKNRIPNGLIALTAVLGAAWRFWSGGAWEMLFCLAQAAAVMVFFYPFFKIGGLGAGDVKLLGVTAGYFPVDRIPAFLFCFLLAAAAVSLVRTGRRRDFWERMRYLLGYLTETVKRGSWRLYAENQRDVRSGGVCLAGPILFSVLLHLGGVY